MVENQYLVTNKSSAQSFVTSPLLAVTEVRGQAFPVSLQPVFSAAGILVRSSIRSPPEQWCFGAVTGQHGLSTPSTDLLWGWGLETGWATPGPWTLLLWSQLYQVIHQVPPCRSGIVAHHSHDHFDPTGWDLVWGPGWRSSVVSYTFYVLTVVPSVGLFTPTCLSVVDSLLQPGAGLQFGLGCDWVWNVWHCDGCLLSR